LLREAFESVASHICNLSSITEIVEQIDRKTDSVDDVIEELESLLEGAEATFRTDIRILINECRHLRSRKKAR